MTEPTLVTIGYPFSGDDLFDPLEEAARQRVRDFNEATVEAERVTALGRCRNQPSDGSPGYRICGPGNMQESNSGWKQFSGTMRPNHALTAQATSERL